MYIVELKTGDWYCSESKKKIIEITGKPDSQKCKNIVLNLWYQPFNYKSGVMSDFFWVIKNGEDLEESVPMRDRYNNLPLTKCKTGIVKFLGNNQPKWYKEFLNQ